MGSVVDTKNGQGIAQAFVLAKWAYNGRCLYQELLQSNQSGQYVVPDVTSAMEPRRSWLASSFTWLLPADTHRPDFQLSLYVAAFKSRMLPLSDKIAVENTINWQPFISAWQFRRAELVTMDSARRISPIVMADSGEISPRVLTYYSNLISFSVCDVRHRDENTVAAPMVSAIRTDALDVPCRLAPDVSIGETDLHTFLYDTSAFDWVIPRLQKLTGMDMDRFKSVSARTLCQAATNAGPAL